MTQLQIPQGCTNFANNSSWDLGTEVRCNAGLWRVGFRHINNNNNNNNGNNDDDDVVVVVVVVDDDDDDGVHISIPPYGHNLIFLGDPTDA